MEFRRVWWPNATCVSCHHLLRRHRSARPTPRQFHASPTKEYVIHTMLALRDTDSTLAEIRDAPIEIEKQKGIHGNSEDAKEGGFRLNVLNGRRQERYGGVAAWIDKVSKHKLGRSKGCYAQVWHVRALKTTDYPLVISDRVSLALLSQLLHPGHCPIPTNRPTILLLSLSGHRQLTTRYFDHDEGECILSNTLAPQSTASFSRASSQRGFQVFDSSFL
jgi:hypothetical protein